MATTDPTTDRRYVDWIEQYEQRRMAVIQERMRAGTYHIDGELTVAWAVRNQCYEASQEMVTAFPELRRVRGHYGNTEHWWCETADHTIVDPTAKQFKPGFSYIEHTGPDPIGKCMNCGDLVWNWDHSGACSAGCLVGLNYEYG